MGKSPQMRSERSSLNSFQNSKSTSTALTKPYNPSKSLKVETHRGPMKVAWFGLILWKRLHPISSSLAQHPSNTAAWGQGLCHWLKTSAEARLSSFQGNTSAEQIFSTGVNIHEKLSSHVSVCDSQRDTFTCSDSPTKCNSTSLKAE